MDDQAGLGGARGELVVDPADGGGVELVGDVVQTGGTEASEHHATGCRRRRVRYETPQIWMRSDRATRLIL